MDICFRCGGFHKTCQCPSKNPPPIDFLNKAIQKNIRIASSKVPNEWKRDDFGYCIMSTVELDDKSTPKGNRSKKILFCLNCGRQGHSSKSCPFPSYEELNVTFSHKDAKDKGVKETVNNLKKMAGHI